MAEGLTMPANRILGIKGKEKLFNGIKNYIELLIDYKLGKLPKEQCETAEKEFKLMITDLEWRLE